MKERPILFSAPMVRAILNSSKTQTRRVLKQAAGPSLSVDVSDVGVAELSWLHGDGPGHDVEETIKHVACPYGAPGDHLWVRESFWGCDMPGWGDQPCVVYEDEWHGKEYRPAEVRPHARRFGHIPGIHMPRDASRITLEVTDVRVERLQDISVEDCIAEGMSTTLREHDAGVALRYDYSMLWDAINGVRSWDANPYVWVVEFRRIAA